MFPNNMLLKLMKYIGVCPVIWKNFEVLCLRAAALYGAHVLKNKKISFC